MVLCIRILSYRQHDIFICLDLKIQIVKEHLYCSVFNFSIFYVMYVIGVSIVGYNGLITHSMIVFVLDLIIDYNFYNYNINIYIL